MPLESHDQSMDWVAERDHSGADEEHTGQEPSHRVDQPLGIAVAVRVVAGTEHQKMLLPVDRILPPWRMGRGHRRGKQGRQHAEEGSP